MVELAQLRDIGETGLILDISHEKLTPGTVTNGKNFRVANKGITSVFASNPIIETTTANAGFLFPVTTPTGDFLITLGRSAIHAYNGASATDITPSGGITLGTNDEYKWSGCMLGQIPIFNNIVSYPYYWSPQTTGTLLQALKFTNAQTWVQKGYHAKVFRSHGAYLFALNLIEGVTELPDTFRWSHPADVNGLPFTWDETDLSAVAGKASLGGDGGQIIDGLSLRDSFVIYSQNAINVLRPSGDDQVWSRRQISSNYGVVSKDVTVEVDGRHFFIIAGDILTTDGNSIESIAHQKIRKTMDIRANYEYYENSFTIKNPIRNEIWFCVPENGSVLPNAAYVFNYKDGTWAFRELSESLAHATYGKKVASPITYETYDGTETPVTFENFDLPYSYAPYSENGVIGISPTTGRLVSMDDNSSDSSIQSIIEAINIEIDQVPDATSITRVYPYMSGDIDVQIQFGSQDFINGPVKWRPAVNFNPFRQRKIDVRTSGKFHAYRISSTSSKNWSFTGMDIEYERSGVR